jgi:hypothetical protein
VRITRDGPGKGEEYQITHPAAQVNGILKGSYYGTMSESISVTVRGTDDAKTRLRCLIEYKDESWLGKPRFLIEGVIYRYNVGNADEAALAESWTKCKQVPADKVVAQLEGNWMRQIRYRYKGDKVSEGSKAKEEYRRCVKPRLPLLCHARLLNQPYSHHTHRSGRSSWTWTSSRSSPRLCARSTSRRSRRAGGCGTP